MVHSDRIHHLRAICLSYFLFCLASPHHLILSFAHPRPWVECGEWGVSGVAQVRCRQKAERVQVKLLWPRLFISSRLWLKTLAAAIQRLSAVFFNQSRGVTLESESTCSHVPPGLRRDRHDCQRATWNTWVRIKTACHSRGCSHVLLLSESAICCFVFSRWIRANKENKDGWTPSVGSSLSVGTSCILELTLQPSCTQPGLFTSQYSTSTCS